MASHDKYTATKEEAHRLYVQVSLAAPLELSILQADLLVFLEACVKRLPTKVAIDRDRARRSTRKGLETPEETTSE